MHHMHNVFIIHKTWQIHVNLHTIINVFDLKHLLSNCSGYLFHPIKFRYTMSDDVSIIVARTGFIYILLYRLL